MSERFSRRSLLKVAGAATGAAVGTRVLGPWARSASAANEKSALLVIHGQGGHNQMFTAADCCIGRFGVTPQEVETIGNGLAIHAPTFGTLSEFTKTHMAAIGADVPAGADHDRATRMQMYDPNGVPWITQIAAAMGGEASIKAAHLNVDDSGFGIGKAPSVGGVSLQGITDFSSILERIPQLGVTPPPDPNKPDREISGAAMRNIEAMSKSALDKNQRSLVTLREGYSTARGLFDRVPKAVDFNDIKSAYGISGNESFDVSARTAKFAAAELLIRSGTNVVFMHEGGDFDYSSNFLWTFDSHAPGGTRGLHERHLWNLLIGGLRTFTSRMLEDPDFNVVVLCIGDFSRTNGQTNSADETNNGHGSVLSASVMGRYVKTGTTGRTYDAGYGDERFEGNASPGRLTQMWACVADMLKVGSNPFGANPHPLVL